MEIHLVFTKVCRINPLEELWTQIDKGKRGENVGKSSGMKKLDKIIGGIQPHRYYLVGAASSVGKTSYILYIIYNLLKQESPDAPIYFLYFSLEIGADILLAKLMSLYCAEEFGVYLTVNDILSFESPLNDSNYDYLIKSREWLTGLMQYLIVIDTSVSASSIYKNTLDFAAKVGQFNQVGNSKIYTPNNQKQLIIGVLDHFALARCEEGRTLKQEIDLMSSYMVTLKRKLPLSWFVLMQQNRESSSMDRRKADMSEPGLNDLKDSGSPSQDADIVLQLFFPFREKLKTYRGFKVLDDDGIGQALRSVIISKNRYGIANQVICLGFWGSVGWFKELPDPKNITDFTKFKIEQGNIPCKLFKQEDVVSLEDTKETKEQKITFSF